MNAAGSAAPALRIALDIRHPLAYLALAPAIGLAGEVARGVDFVPVVGQALRAPSQPRPEDDRGVRHRRHRAHMIAREISVYARARGLTIRDPYRSGPSRAVNLAWLWVRRQAPASLPAFLEEAFRRYWTLELEPDDPGDADELLRGLGLAPGFDTWSAREGRDTAQRIASELRRDGVHQAPAYLLEGEVFYGRQHLPMIRWILNGRAGPGPI